MFLIDVQSNSLIAFRAKNAKSTFKNHKWPHAKTNKRVSQLKNTISHETFPLKEKRVRNYFLIDSRVSRMTRGRASEP
jgi:hypothetical protein